MAKKYLGNAFSLSMIPGNANLSIVEIDKNEIPFDEVISVIGHQDIADLLNVEVNRVTTRLNKDDILYVAQYVGERLPEGCCKLPKNAKISYRKVTINKRRFENIVTSFFYYMWNTWGTEEEIKIVFPEDHLHFTAKWQALFDRYEMRASENFYSELTPDNRERLVNRACALYDGRTKIINP